MGLTTALWELDCLYADMQSWKEFLQETSSLASDDFMRTVYARCSITSGHLLLTRMPAVEETSNAMALDGIMFEGVSVRVRRPNDYNPAAAAALGPSVPNPALNLAAIGLQPGAGTATAGGVSRLPGYPVEHCRAQEMPSSWLQQATARCTARQD